VVSRVKNILLWSVLILPYILLVPAYFWHLSELEGIRNSNIVLVNKQQLKLFVYSYSGELKLEAPIACGRRYGNKQKVGDFRTPEGVFSVTDIEDSQSWAHDFKDGKGEIQGAYGPYFIRLLTPNHKGIGLHGTHDPGSLGKRATEGCIRLHNNQISLLAKLVKPGTIVVITPAVPDEAINQLLFQVKPKTRKKSSKQSKPISKTLKS
jgi:hypothetical protein